MKLSCSPVGAGQLFMRESRPFYPAKQEKWYEEVGKEEERYE